MATPHKPVILLIRNAAAGDFGGAETYQISLSKILQRNNLSPIIVTRSQKLLNASVGAAIKAQKGWWWSRQNWSGKRLALLPLYLVWQIILTGWYITLIWRTKASVLHIQSKDDFIAATIAGRVMKKQVIWTDHMDLRYIFENIGKPLRNPVGKLVFWAGYLAHHIIVISNNEHRLVTGHFKRKTSLKRQITLVNNGVIDQLDTLSRDTSENKAYFSFCLASRIVANKGVGEAIEAFTLLQQQLPGKAVRLDIYGDGKDADHFKQLAKANPSIVFHGHQSNVLEKVVAADVFMLPSYQEGFSIALLEATMLGKAIIASNVDSNPEIITNDQTGLLVPARDPKALMDAMYRLYTQPDTLGLLEKNARANYEENYNLDTIVPRFIIPLYDVAA